MRLALAMAVIAAVALAGCERPQQAPAWYAGYPPFTPGWTLSYAAPGDEAAPEGRWLNVTFEANETIRNWTTQRYRMVESPAPSTLVDSDMIAWYDVESKGIVRQGGDFTVTSDCPLQDVRLEGIAEWSCRASSWWFDIRQERTGTGSLMVGASDLDEIHFQHTARVNGAQNERTFSYSPTLGFFTRLQSEGFASPEPYVLQRVGSCRMDGMLMPDPSACGPWPAPRFPSSTSAPTR